MGIVDEESEKLWQEKSLPECTEGDRDEVQSCVWTRRLEFKLVSWCVVTLVPSSTSVIYCRIVKMVMSMRSQWGNCIFNDTLSHGITGFLDFVHRPEF
jgi:hypothetical protein